MEREWFIYVLSLNGVDVYVGRTVNCERRKMQHKCRFGRDVELRVVETGIGKREGNAAEIRWIEKLIHDGVALMNRIVASSGAWELDTESLARLKESSTRRWQDPAYRAKHNAALRKAQGEQWLKRRREAAREAWDNPAARAKMLPQIVALGKRTRTAADNAALSAKTKGRQKNWSPEGAERVAATRFKPGHYKFSELPPDIKEHHLAARRRQWDGISKEERSRRATERNLAAWAKRTPEERAAVGKKISDGLGRQSPECRKELAAKAAAALWKGMTPERKALLIERRGSPERRREIASMAAKALWKKRKAQAQ